jgi:predicted deacylase
MTDTRRSRLVAEVDLEKEGKQQGLVRLFHSTHASAYGFIGLPIVVIRNGSGPTGLLLGGNHGDEYEGQLLMANLARSLQPSQITGRLIIMPCLNMPASLAGRRTSPIDDANLNRCFPGNPDGTVTQQIAYFVQKNLFPLSDFVIDLHSGGSSLMYVPSAVGRKFKDPKRQQTMMAMLEAFGAPISFIGTGSEGTGADQTLTGGAEAAGLVALGSELGGSGTVTREAMRWAERGLRNVLVDRGILPARERMPNETKSRIMFTGGDDYFVYASENGVWEPLVELGEMVKRGQPAAHIHWPESPWNEPVTVNFKRDGLVICRRQPGRTTRGDCLFHLSTDEDPYP